MFLHDAAYLYLLILAEVLDEGLEPRNYTLFFDRAKNRTFEGIFQYCREQISVEIESLYNNFCITR